MAKPDAKTKKPKKLSRKDISNMSNAEFIEAAKVPYLRLLSYVKPYRFRFGMSVAFGIFAGFFNMIILFGLKFVFAVILGDPTDPETAFKPFEKVPVQSIAKWELRPPDLPAGREWIWIAGVCAIVPALILMRGLLTYLHQYFMIWVGNRVLFALRDDVFKNLLNQSLGFFSKAKTGELMQTVFNQTRMSQSAATQLASDLIKHPVSILSIVIFLLITDWRYTLAALVLFPACILPVMVVAKRVRRAGGKEEEEAGMLMVTMQETFSGIRVVKSFAREPFERHRFNRANERMLAFIMRWRKAMEIVGPLVETFASVGIAAGLVYAKVTNMGIDDFMIMNMALMSMYPHAKALSRVQIHLQKCVIASTKVFSFIDWESDIQDAKDAVELKNARGKIQFYDVTFNYPGSQRPAVWDVSVKLNATRNFALVGKSGSGKSTMLSLIMRFYDPRKGHIEFDDIDLRQIKQHSLRDHIGMVNQEVFLFHDSIANNIRYGRPEATKEEIMTAAKRAHAHEFIMEKPGGYDAKVGDKGCTLSGGQQQRISIARAILRDAPVLLLDEAYSALDSESEKEIHAAIEELARGKTVIAIAHRLSTILNADQIIVMDEGRIVAKGTHEKLLQTSPVYQRLYELQFNTTLPESEPVASPA